MLGLETCIPNTFCKTAAILFSQMNKNAKECIQPEKTRPVARQDSSPDLAGVNQIKQITL